MSFTDGLSVLHILMIRNYYPYWRFNNEKLENVKENEGDKHIKHNTDLSTEDAIKFINRNKNNPFFSVFSL